MYAGESLKSELCGHYLQGADEVSRQVWSDDDCGGDCILQQLLIDQRMLLEEANHSHQSTVALGWGQELLGEFLDCFRKVWTKS